MMRYFSFCWFVILYIVLFCAGIVQRYLRLRTGDRRGDAEGVGVRREEGDKEEEIYW